MIRWWDKHSFQTTLIVLALVVAFLIKQTQADALSEVYYFMVSPFQSQQQLILEDKLTNARILELEQLVTELEQQNQQFKKLLDYADSQKTPAINAPIIGRNADRWWNRLTLGKGAKDGIKPGFVAMGIGGLVGRVTHVTPHTSKVLLISDAESRVGATLSRNRQLGYIQGKDSQTVVMHFFTKVVDIKTGDQITTSNLSNLYPAGLPLGRVKAIKSDGNSDSGTEIELTAPIDILEWVTVQPFQPRIATK